MYRKPIRLARNSIAALNVNCSEEERAIMAMRMHNDCISGGTETKARGNLAIT
jgi:hypothetical protein